MGNKLFGLLVSSFNMDNFAAYLNNATAEIEIEFKFAKYAQTFQTLLNDNLWTDNLDFAVIWTLPEDVSKAFDKLLNFQDVTVQEILEEVDWYCELVNNISGKVKKAVFIPTWTVTSSYHTLGMLDMKQDFGISNILMQMNLRLSANSSKKPNIYILNTQKWTEIVGRKRAFNPIMWYMGKMPFGNEVFKEAVSDVVSALNAISGNKRKLVILDLDDTLWGGVVGEVGWKNIVIGGHDSTGEALVDFQKALKVLAKRGILLGIVSKNEESTALEAIEKHPEMILRLNDFAGWRINWKDKAENILELVAELNLGLDSTVFIDDRESERDRIRTALPEVLVPEWPTDKMFYRSTLLNLRCFDSPLISAEDSQRTQMYVSERHRKVLKREMGSLDDWLKNLNTKVDVELMSEVNLPRTIQLLNKTNQMNLATRRMTEIELMAWAEQKNHRLWTFRVSDRFGDSGLTGIISLQIQKDTAEIVDFVLSCRVMGRKIEEAMLHTAISYAQSFGINHICAKYLPTSKNRPCLEFFKGAGFAFDVKNNVFTWQTKKTYNFPSCISIRRY